MPDLKRIDSLFQETSEIIDRHKEIMIAKGEHFNLFSILGIESKENKTHSAFLVELLNPKGSHLQNDTFLNLFLQVIQEEINESKNSEALRPDVINRFNNLSQTQVSPEFNVGRRNDYNKEGGRVDIYLKNGENIICIENKIYAGDQNCQIERYCNHKNGNNTVLYLTLKGDEPHIKSKGILKAGVNYYNISYKKHIVKWLEMCREEVPNLISVRESINQYILLIKKLTNTLNMKQEKELTDLILNNLEESRFVAGKYYTTIKLLKANFRKNVKKNLEEQLGPEFEVKLGKDIDKLYSKLWIQPLAWKALGLRFGIEPFSGKGNLNGELFVGLFNKSDSEILMKLPAENKLNNVWHHTRPILTDDGNNIKLNDLFSLEKLAKGEGPEYDNLLETVVNKSIEFVNQYKAKIAALKIEETTSI